MSTATIEKPATTPGDLDELIATAEKWIGRWSAYPASDDYAAAKLARWVELRDLLAVFKSAEAGR